MDSTTITLATEVVMYINMTQLSNNLGQRGSDCVNTDSVRQRSSLCLGVVRFS